MARNLIITTLILVALTSRFLFETQEWFPVVALALFTAAYVREKRASILLLVGGLFLTDLALGLHGLIPVVYSSLLAVLFIGFATEKNPPLPRFLTLTAFGVAAYFLLTNFGVWALGGCSWVNLPEYPKTFAGLLNAYSSGLPGLPVALFGNVVAALLLHVALLSAERLLPAWSQILSSGSRQGTPTRLNDHA